MENTADALLDVEIDGYCRISVDEELDKDNTSIENQKEIIMNFVAKKFPKCNLKLFVDRDRSGYTFDQREDYQRMRKRLMSGTSKILVVKDFSRFSRRNSKGLVELEDLRDAGVRIISINDSIDYPTFDDWMAIQFRFLINEMPVTDASKKVKSVIRRRQEDGKWICSVPYGYVISNMKKQEISVVPDEAEVIRDIYSKYLDGWGYKKIANYLTDHNIPTPRMKEKERAEARGDEYKRKDTKTSWSIVSVQTILSNDFYVGTLRHHKYKRKKINGTDVKIDPSENYVFENHHEAIIDDKTWTVTQEMLKQRTTGNYRGIKKYDNVYSGFMICGDCGSPMFSMSRGDLAAAYVCGTYHNRGLKGCTSHHTRVDMLDAIVKDYIRKVRDNSDGMLKQLESSIKTNSVEANENENTILMLDKYLDDAKQELKVLKKRKIKELTKIELQAELDEAAKSKMDIIEETYQELEDELTLKIAGLQNQIANTSEKRNEIVRINRLARTVIDVFNDILEKPTLDRVDLQFIIDKIVVYDGRIEIKLKADIDAILHLDKHGEEEVSVNFEQDSKVILNNGGKYPAELSRDVLTPAATNYHLKTRSHGGKLFTVNVISNGDPLEIFTGKEGEIVLKKYSPMADLTAFAQQYVEAISQSLGLPVAITDRDSVIAVAGMPKKELMGKELHSELENVINDRKTIVARKGDAKFIHITTDDMDYAGQVVQTIISEGDAVGAVIVIVRDSTHRISEIEQKAAVIAAAFLGKQMEG